MLVTGGGGEGRLPDLEGGDRATGEREEQDPLGDQAGGTSDGLAQGEQSVGARVRRTAAFAGGCPQQDGERLVGVADEQQQARGVLLVLEATAFQERLGSAAGERRPLRRQQRAG